MPIALLVDDDATDARRVASALAEAEYTVLLAAGAVQALALYADRRPDLVVSDVSTPGYDGPTLLRALRAGGCMATFIAMTVDLTPEVRAWCQDAGAAVCLTKPVDLALLLTTAEELLADGPQLDPEDDPLDAELLRTLRETYLALLPQRTAALREATDMVELAQAAHKLAGASAQFGYPGLAALCRSVQRSARADRVAPELMDAVVAAATHAATTS